MSDIALPDGLIPLIKSTTRAAVTACVVPGSTGPQRVEQLTGYSAGTISRWGGDAHKDLASLEAVFLMEFVSQKPVFARALAALTGHRLVPIEDGDQAGDLIGDLVRTSGSGGRVTTVLGAALADGVVTSREREDVRRAVSEHVSHLTALERKLSGLPASDGEG